jgi:hypothetical protein
MIFKNIDNYTGDRSKHSISETCFPHDTFVDRGTEELGAT